MADEMNFEAAAYTAQGTERGEKIALPTSTFDGTVNMPVMHQAVKAFLANQRQGNASTKTRSFVIGGNQKPWKQKGTGRARQGSTRAPHWVGGGTVFGPTPRAYDQYVPRQVRALAKKSALNARARENAIVVIDRFQFDAPKTSRMAALVGSLGLDGKKVLVLTDGVKSMVHLSARNLPTVHVMPFTDSSTYHILWSDVVLIESAALGQSLEPIAESEAAPKRPAKKAAKKAAAADEGDEGEARPAAKKASAKKGAKKTSARGTPKTAAKKTATKKTATKSAAKKSSAAKPPAAKKSAAKKKSASKRAKE